jgi:four helix bundle protein
VRPLLAQILNGSLAAILKRALISESPSGTSVAHQSTMAGWKHFEEIVAWQLARGLKLQIDEYLKRPQFKQHRRLSEQLSDAARSGPANIAEGFGRHSNRDFARFLRIAKASEAEVLNHSIDALDQRLITETEFREIEYLARKAMKAAIGLIRHLEQNQPPTG